MKTWLVVLALAAPLLACHRKAPRPHSEGEDGLVNGDVARLEGLAAHARSSTTDCPDRCEDARDGCELTREICDVAARHADRSDLQGRCTDAQETCARLNEGCAGCKRP